MKQFIIADESQSEELVSLGFTLFKIEESPAGRLYYFFNDKALFEQYTKTGKKLFTTNTLTF